METKNSQIGQAFREIEPNPFFRAYNSIVIDITNSFDNQDTVEIVMTDSTAEFKLNDEQELFFKNLYVPANPFEKDNHIKKLFLEKHFPELLNIPHGYNEWQLIDFIIDPRYDLSNLASIVAPIGRGKTSLLQYTLLYIREKVPYLKEKFMPIVFNCHEFKIFFKNKNNLNRTFEYLTKEVFLPKFTTVLKPFIDQNNSEFWDYYLENANSFYTNKAKAILNNIKRVETAEAKDGLLIELSNLQSEELQTEQFIHTALKFLKRNKGIEIVFALDNLDLLGIDAVEGFIDYVERLRINSTIRILLVLRTVTYNKIMERYRGALEETIHEWIPINSKDVIFKRCDDLSRRIIEEAETIPFEINNKSVKISDIGISIKNITSVISKNYSMINTFSNENLRLQMKLLRILLKSGWLPNWVYHTALLPNMDLSIEKDIPKYVITQAIVTNNFSTYIEEQNNIKGLVNVLSENSEIVLYNFLPLMILSNLKKNNYKLINLDHIHKILVQFFDFYDDDIVLDTLFYSIITKLLNNGLLTSPEAYEIEVGDDIRKIVKNIKMSILGKYYINSLIYDYNYLVNVKDEVQLQRIDFEGCIKNRDLCESEGEMNYYKFTRLNIEDINIFFNEFGKLEISFLKTLKNSSRVVAYKSLFCSAKDNFYTLNMVENTLEQFNNARFLHKDLINKLQSTAINLKTHYENELMED